ncbi:hypothetical protein Cylst_5514 [Cylindrospermum stagnale PCC 7417]|uniref:Uncharacterized protein n=1 Tax=Cylindrospermum stagnale PCC 7417 TaxID=56107 RepID=K9X4E4_9NOST|nr:hypothetical protein [Cylindrospermum stagnale]AFZ27525.1 hypothetical protein Cylst_5514 [Cylindrospermum stagnale PCC 7417]
MNIHLSSEVIWSLAITSLIGLWLIWQAVRINSDIDILQLSVNWFRDRPIILPSLLFLISPFLSTYIFHNLSPDFNKILDNKIIAQLLITFGAVISIYIGNRALESFRKTQEQKKIAKILIASMEFHCECLKEIDRSIQDFVYESDMENIEFKVTQSREDNIYESTIKQIGVLKIEDTDKFYKYYTTLNSLLGNIMQNEKARGLSSEKYREIKIFKNYHHQQDIQEKIEIFFLDINLYLMSISKEILLDIDKFNKYKELLKADYSKIRRKNHTHGKMYDLLRRTEKLFKKYGLLAELEDHYNRQKSLWLSYSTAQELNEEN